LRIRKDVSSKRKRTLPKQWNDWRWQFRNRVRSPGGLNELPGFLSEQVGSLRKVARVYRCAITPYYLSLFDPRDEADPLRLQCIPDEREITFSSGGRSEERRVGKEL
jgi:lysine 2,3-aminomutase